jgi:hypothetical protein
VHAFRLKSGRRVRERAFAVKEIAIEIAGGDVFECAGKNTVCRTAKQPAHRRTPGMKHEFDALS